MKAYVPRGSQSGTMHLMSARSQSPQSPQIWSAVNCAHTQRFCFAIMAGVDRYRSADPL